MHKPRGIRRILKTNPTMEGAGVHLKRAFGFREVPQLDPFLLLDDFHSDRPADYLPGFPWHPHRGIETITYVLHGQVEHGDSMGNRSVIRAGDVQWMTAGSGVIHQEMPKGDSGGLLWGFQLWANLPAAHKMMDPRYREVKSTDIPVTVWQTWLTAKYTVIFTNREGSPEEAVRWHNQRGECRESRIKELKIGLGMERMPCGQWGANAVFFRVASVACNLGRLFVLSTLGKSWHRNRVQTQRWKLHETAGNIVFHGRHVYLKVPRRLRELFAKGAGSPPSLAPQTPKHSSPARVNRGPWAFRDTLTGANRVCDLFKEHILTDHFARLHPDEMFGRVWAPGELDKIL